MMSQFFETFMQMRDKEQVGLYLKQFIKSAAYFGFTEGVNME
jgi:hypothetical protein